MPVAKANPTPSASFRTAHGQAAHWGLAAKMCLDGLGRLRGDENIGFLYVTEAFAADLASILTFLRETTRIEDWVGAGGHGICAGGVEYHSGGAIAVMVGALPHDSFRILSGFDGDEGAFRARNGAWAAAHAPLTGIVHGDPRTEDIADIVAALAHAGDAFLLGGLTAGQTQQVAGSVTGEALSGVLMDSRVALLSGLTQGCSRIGPIHRVTEAMEGVVLRIDDRPALDVLKAEAGDIIARDLRKAAGYVHVALPVPGSDTGDYTVRTLLAVDPQHGWLAVGADLAPGDPMMFVRRDANTAQADLARMLRQLAARVPASGIRGGLYVSCVARGAHMFGDGNREVEMIRDELGDFPLVGFTANGEICHDRLYGYTGVLALLV